MSTKQAERAAEEISKQSKVIRDTGRTLRNAQIIDTAFADVVKERDDCKAENEQLKAENETLKSALAMVGEEEEFVQTETST